MESLVVKIAKKIAIEDLRKAKMDPNAMREFQRKGPKAAFIDMDTIKKLRLLARDVMPLARMRSISNMTERDLVDRFVRILKTRNPKVRASIERQLEEYK